MVDATDRDGSITKVNFYIDGVEKSTVTTSPYHYDWVTTGESIGTHTLKSVCTDNGGASSSAEISVKIIESGSAPTCDFTADTTSGMLPLTVIFTDQSTDSPTTWLWEFGDGDTSSQQNPSHTYNIEGSYTVALTVSNSFGSDFKVKTSYILVEAAGSAPICDFSVDTTSGILPLTVIFTDQSTETPTTWQWEFGDGGISTEQNPSYTYANEGIYTVTLTVSNSFGSDTKTETDYIHVNNNTIGEPCPGTLTVTDADGNVYNTVQIGEQCWMKENLRVGTRIDGSQQMNDNSVIEKYCYGNVPSNCETYGGLYQWNEMMQYTTTPGAQGICPDDWHLPTDNEWKTMEMALGMSQSEADFTGWRGTDEGDKIKSTTNWNNDGNGTDSSGFSALPGGFRDSNTYFYGYGTKGYWWISSTGEGWYRYLHCDYSTVYRMGGNKLNSFSVRCVKD